MSLLTWKSLRRCRTLMLNINPDSPHPATTLTDRGDGHTPQFTYNQIIGFGALQNLDVYFSELFAIYQGTKSVKRYAQGHSLLNARGGLWNQVFCSLERPHRLRKDAGWEKHFLNSPVSLCRCTSDSLCFIAVRVSLAALAPSCPGSPAAAFNYTSPLSRCANHLPLARLHERLDKRLRSYVNSPWLCRASALVRLDSDHIFPRQRPGSYANQAMRYLAPRGRRLRSHALALDLHHELIYHVLPTSQSSNIPSRCNE